MTKIKPATMHSRAYTYIPHTNKTHIQQIRTWKNPRSDFVFLKPQVPLASCQCGYAITQHGLKLHYSITHSSSGNTGLTFREPPEDPYPRQNSILHTACPALSSKTSITKMRRLGVSERKYRTNFCK